MCDGIPVELLQILKYDAVKVLHSICQKSWKPQQRPQDWKRSVFISTPKKGNTKECSNYCTIVLISHPSKVMPQILQARFQQYVNHVQAELRKGQRSNCQHLLDHRKKQKISRKTSTTALLITPKPLTGWITTNWKILKDGKFLKMVRSPDLPPAKSVHRSRSNS